MLVLQHTSFCYVYSICSLAVILSLWLMANPLNPVRFVKRKDRNSRCSAVIAPLFASNKGDFTPNDRHWWITTSDTLATRPLLGWCTKCRPLARPECKIHASRDIKLLSHSCSLRQGARVVHDAAATHPCPSVAARLLPTQTITKFVIHG